MAIEEKLDRILRNQMLFLMMEDKISFRSAVGYALEKTTKILYPEVGPSIKDRTSDALLGREE